jgi:hypothetical protein
MHISFGRDSGNLNRKGGEVKENLKRMKDPLYIA